MRDRQEIKKEHVLAFLEAGDLPAKELNALVEQFAAPILQTPHRSLVTDLYQKTISASEGKQYKPLYKKILSTGGDDPALADDLLKLAKLSVDESYDFFLSYAPINYSFCHRAPTARALYGTLISSKLEPAKREFLVQCLLRWLSKDMGVNEIDELLNVAEPVLIRGEKVVIIENYGPRELTRNSKSVVLRKLVRDYLDDIPETSFQAHPPAPDLLLFLHGRYKEYLPAEQKELVLNWYTLWDFLQCPSYSHGRIYQIVLLLHGKLPLSPGTRLAYMEPLALALARCIDNALQLSIVFATITYLQKAEQLQILKHMFSYVDRMRAESNANDQQWQQRASAYLQFALSADIIDGITTPPPPTDKDKLIQTLLRNSDSRFLSFVEQQAQGWPPTLQQQWNFLKGQYRHQRPQTPTIPVREMSPLAASTLPAATPSSSHPATAGVPRQRWLSGAKIVITWLYNVFIWLYYLLLIHWKLKRLSTQQEPSGTGKYVVFWYKYEAILRKLERLHLLPHALRQELQFAYEFYDACQVADTETQLAYEQKIMQLVRIPARQSYYEKVRTAHESVRISLAREFCDKFPADALNAPSSEAQSSGASTEDLSAKQGFFSQISEWRQSRNKDKNQTEPISKAGNKGGKGGKGGSTKKTKGGSK